MIKTADLKAQTKRELAELAKNYGVQGWHSMNKADLVDAISRVQRRLRRKANAEAKTRTSKSPASRTTVKQSAKSQATTRKVVAKPSAKSRSRSAANPAAAKPTADKPQKVSPKTARIRAHLRRQRADEQRNKDLSTAMLVAGAAVKNGAERSRATEQHRDRAILLVRDSYWLQATWEITRASVDKARTTMAEQWHTAKPILRLLKVGDVNSNSAETIERDIPIHGGVNNWYIDVQDPPSRYRILIGYVTSNDEFHTLCRSNVVETPRPGECERLDEHWRDIAEDYERIYSLSGGYDTDGGDLKDVFEERLHRQMPQRGEQGQVIGDPALLRQTKLPFIVDAELIVFGKTDATATVMVAGHPVKLQPDGSFTVRMEFPDKRQVLPVTAESRDGLRQRKTVLSVERNTKVMEAVELDERT